ncbi:hypothetical protein RN001_013827 [Aquatica leii]|uniref:Uncharacterized protein n=1 Tax=Aquatica leii TaxID=1421715 RepID=A0AAN7P0K2_9COLE|nr:hypothetical protein RN001_013827 [Aquatica leii]
MENDHKTTVKNKLSMFYQENREKSFKSWNWKATSNCSAKKLAEAGFYFIGTQEEPDAVQCFFCDKALDGWDEDDDPWQEHKTHSLECAFAKTNLSEDNLTTGQRLDFHSQLVKKLIKQYVDVTLKHFNQDHNVNYTKIKKAVNGLKRSRK